jgi:hypothetical protein
LKGYRECRHGLVSLSVIASNDRTVFTQLSSVGGTAIGLKGGTMETENLGKWLTVVKPPDSLGFSDRETVTWLRNH